MKINLARALRVNRDARMAFVGAGGKTTAINLLAAEISPPLIVTSSTHVGRSQLKIKHRYVEYMGLSQLAQLFPMDDEILFITGTPVDSERMMGLEGPTLVELSKMGVKYHIPLLIEADGSRGLPIKAPAAHEPNIPGCANRVVVVAGLSSLGKRFNPEIVHRFDNAQKITGLANGQMITIEAIEKLLSHPDGGLKRIPDGARKIALLNQVDTAGIRSQAEILANRLQGYYDSIVIASLAPVNSSGRSGNADSENIHKVIETTAGVILAAGESSRYGSPKLLNVWKGEPIIRHVILHAIQAGLSPVIVVLGAIQEPIINEIKDLPASYVINKNWKEGQSTSLHCGINALPADTGSAVFLLADQPHIPVDLITALMQLHYESLATVIIPRVRRKRANPVLFDRDAFDDLKRVKGDQGGRAIFEKYPITWLPWQDDTILMDIDTPEDYQNLLKIS